MKIALIGPGLQPIPSVGWGAVESIIWEYTTRLRRMGHSVRIFNRENGETWDKSVEEINKGDFDFVHCMYDDHAGWLQNYLKVPFCTTTHYGYINKRPMWGGYQWINQGVLMSDGIIALSPQIENNYRQQGYNGFLTHLRNGAAVDKIRYTDHPSKDVICLGKIEERKQQAELAYFCEGKINVDFVGPITDHRFKPGQTCKYLGEWTREQVYQNLTDYKVLVLPSLGEAHALVIPEAITAGLTVVVSDAASANLHNCPYYKVFDAIQHIAKILKFELDRTPDRRVQSEWGYYYFNWDSILTEYLEIIQKFKEHCCK